MRYLKPAMKDVRRMFFLPGTSLLLSCGGLQRAIAVHDMLAKRESAAMKLLPRYKRRIWGFTLSPDESQFLSVGGTLQFQTWETRRLDKEPRIKWFDRDQKTVRFVEPTLSRPPVTYWTPDRSTWRVFCQAVPKQHVENAESLGVSVLEFDPEARSIQIVGTFERGSLPHACQVRADGSVIVLRTLIDAEGARLILERHVEFDDHDSSTTSVVLPLRPPHGVLFAALCPVTDRVAVALTSGLVVAEPGGSPSATLEPIGLSAAPVFLPDGSLLTAGPNGSVVLWQVDPLRKLAEWEWEVGPITALASSADGSLLAAAGERIVIWDRE